MCQDSCRMKNTRRGNYEKKDKHEEPGRMNQLRKTDEKIKMKFKVGSFKNP